MTRRPTAPIPGPADAPGAFVLIDDVADADEPPAEELELAAGSDVHDVEEMSRQVDTEALDEMLREYMESDPEPDESGGE